MSRGEKIPRSRWVRCGKGGGREGLLHLLVVRCQGNSNLLLLTPLVLCVCPRDFSIAHNLRIFISPSSDPPLGTKKSRILNDSAKPPQNPQNPAAVKSVSGVPPRFWLASSCIVAPNNRLFPGDFFFLNPPLSPPKVKVVSALFISSARLPCVYPASCSRQQILGSPWLTLSLNLPR